MNIIEAHKQKYRHWTEDPVYLAIARKIFKKVLDVKGICCTLHDDEIPVPMPYLRTVHRSSPMRWRWLSLRVQVSEITSFEPALS